MQFRFLTESSARFWHAEVGLEIHEAPLTYPQGVMISLRTVAQMNLCAMELMPRGWEVTGVEIVPYALRIACERALRAGVRVHPIRGDVAAPRAAGVGFGLVLNFGYVHGRGTSSVSRWAAKCRRWSGLAPRL